MSLPAMEVGAKICQQWRPQPRSKRSGEGCTAMATRWYTSYPAHQGGEVVLAGLVVGPGHGQARGYRAGGGVAGPGAVLPVQKVGQVPLARTAFPRPTLVPSPRMVAWKSRPEPWRSSRCPARTWNAWWRWPRPRWEGDQLGLLDHSAGMSPATLRAER